MALRHVTYVAMPIGSAMNPYDQLCAWDAQMYCDLHFVTPGEKILAAHRPERRLAVRHQIRKKLSDSNNMLLVMNDAARNDGGWVPFEIEYAVDECSMPIIAAYPGFDYILEPTILYGLWPAALSSRIDHGWASVIHVPFRPEPVLAAMRQFSYLRKPIGEGTAFYSRDAYEEWGILAPDDAVAAEEEDDELA